MRLEQKVGANHIRASYVIGRRTRLCPGPVTPWAQVSGNSPCLTHLPQFQSVPCSASKGTALVNIKLLRTSQILHVKIKRLHVHKAPFYPARSRSPSKHNCYQLSYAFHLSLYLPASYTCRQAPTQFSSDINGDTSQQHSRTRRAVGGAVAPGARFLTVWRSRHNPQLLQLCLY